MIAHELRTPLTVILGMSRMLADGTVDPSMAREAGADIALHADILRDALDGLMLLAMHDSAASLEDAEPIILAAVAADALEAVRPRYPKCAFTLEVADRSAVVEAPPAWVASAIKNLAANAAKYGGTKPVVTVRVQREGDRAVVRVLDRGPGFSPTEADRLFEPFFRTTSGRRQAAGSGLGLALVNRVVRLLGGVAWARSRPGGGAEVGFALPVCGDCDG